MFLIKSSDSCERVCNLFGARVGASSHALDHHCATEKRQNDRYEPHQGMEPVSPAGFAAGPVPPAQEHHVQIKHRDRERDKVKQSREGDHPGAEILKLRWHGPIFDVPP